jgi:hypothetical protein
MHRENQSESLSTTRGRHVQDWQTTEQSESAYCKAHDLSAFVMPLCRYST